MKKILAILICVCVLAFTFVACGSSDAAEASVEEYNRFIVLNEIDMPEALPNVYGGYIVVDRETGVCYLFVDGFHKGSTTVLLDADGKPILWEDYND